MELKKMKTSSIFAPRYCVMTSSIRHQTFLEFLVFSIFDKYRTFMQFKRNKTYSDDLYVDILFNSEKRKDLAENAVM